MEKSTIGNGRRNEVVHRSPSGLEVVRQQLDSPPKINGKKAHMRNLSHGAKTLAVDVDTTKIAPAYVLDSEPSALWIPLNGSERDALSTLIPRQVPHQGNGDQSATSSSPAKTRTAPAKLTNTLADTSVVHAIPGRIRLRVPALKTSPGLAEPLQRLLRDQPGITEVTVNDWCFSVTVVCDPSKWTA
ncbi:MAG TPA: hypothetical protein VFV44_09605, partial [Nitrospiraceae bacterium]|nr:hypothetical protein [Nitrospiraceae bacterium]